MLRDDTAQEDAQSHANVPGDEDGAVGRAALVVAGYIDGHVLESRPEMSVTQPDEQGGAIVARQREKGER